MTSNRLNNHERELWVNNDQYLYSIFNAWKRNTKRERKGSASMRAFLRENREVIDHYITNFSSRR